MMLALVGFNANAAMYIVGDAPFGGWNPPTGVEMTLMEDGKTYTYEATLPGTYPDECTVWFIFSEGAGDWSAVNAGRYDSGDSGNDMVVSANTEFTPVKGNTNKSFKFTGTAGNTYTITFNPTTMVAKVSGIVVPPTSEIWSVVGEPAALFGDPVWNVNNTDNHMELVDGLYTWTKENVELTAGDIQFKVIKNHSYGTSYPANNYSYNVAQSGSYNVTITFDPTTHVITCEATPVGELADNYYIVAGTESLFGSNWNANDSTNMMTKGEENIYTLTKEGYEATAGTQVEFKVVANGNWGTCWPVSDENGNNNKVYEFEEDGIYTVTITFNEETKEINVTSQRTGDLPEPPQPEIDDVYIFGDVNNYAWDPTQGVQMNYNEGIYTAEVTATPREGQEVAYFGFTKKLAEVNDSTAWDAIAPYRFGPVSEGNFLMTEALLGVANELAEEGYESIAIPAGTWTVTVDLVNNTFKVDGTWPTDTVVPEPEIDNVYIIGDVNNIGWSAIDGVQMNYNEENKVYTAEITTQNQGNLGVAYFGFTKMLADSTAEDAWAAIEPYRFGPDSEGAFVMTEDLLATNCDLATDGSYESIALPEGTWTVTVDLVNNKFMIDGTWPVDTVVPEPYTGNLYILGEVNGNSWAPNTGVQMTYNAETALFNAEVTAEASNYDEELQANYSYFSFTKMLAETADDWAAIASSRMGAVADGDFLVTDEQLNKQLSLTNGEKAFKVPSGYTYDITVSVDKMKVIINRVVWELGDVNHDHSVDVGDVTALIAYILGNVPERFFTTEANVDGDAENTYDVGDVTALIAKILAN